MTNQRNKTFPNPTIAEALCEIHFDPVTSHNLITGDVLKTLRAELASDYPSITEQQIKQIQAAFTDRGISVNEENVDTTRLMFKHGKRNHLIQFLPGIMTVNEVEHYPGWDLVLKDIHRGWNALNSGFHQVSPKRIGLRYINVIPRRNPAEPLSEWLKPKYVLSRCGA